MSFEYYGAFAAINFLQQEAGAPKDQAESVGEAIVRHADIGETGNLTSLGQLIQLSTLFGKSTFYYVLVLIQPKSQSRAQAPYYCLWTNGCHTNKGMGMRRTNDKLSMRHRQPESGHMEFPLHMGGQSRRSASMYRPNPVTPNAIITTPSLETTNAHTSYYIVSHSAPAHTKQSSHLPTDPVLPNYSLLATQDAESLAKAVQRDDHRLASKMSQMAKPSGNLKLGPNE
jgi:hypothetical protein